MSIGTLDSITTADVKAYHGITGTDKDGVIAVHLPLVADEIQKYCKHDFLSQSREEKPLIEKLTDRFYLHNRPIASITSIVEGGLTLIEDDDFYVDKGTGLVEKITDLSDITRGQTSKGHWSRVRNDIVVTYVGGVDLTGAQDVVKAFYIMVGIGAGLMKRTFVDNEGVEAVVFINTVPKDIKTILDRYVHRWYSW